MPKRLSTISLLLMITLAACQPAVTAVPTATLPPTKAPTPAPTAVPTSTPIAPPEEMPIAARDGYELVWHDEFDGDSINPENWTYDIGGWGWGNGEAQYYTDRPENSRVENGLLVIEARFERFENSYYTSARLKTQDRVEFQYGWIEARTKVPEGAGLWPAFWMLGANFESNFADGAYRSNWPFVGEIDIMEYVGREPDLVFGTAHGPGYAGALGLGRWNRQEFEIADEFHVSAVEWTYEGITWYFDGEPFFTLNREDVGAREWVFDHEFFIILNLAAGGTFPGTIALSTKFPANYYVDYVRVYQRVP